MVDFDAASARFAKEQASRRKQTVAKKEQDAKEPRARGGCRQSGRRTRRSGARPPPRSRRSRTHCAADLERTTA